MLLRRVLRDITDISIVYKIGETAKNVLVTSRTYEEKVLKVNNKISKVFSY